MTDWVGQALSSQKREPLHVQYLSELREKFPLSTIKRDIMQRSVGYVQSEQALPQITAQFGTIVGNAPAEQILSDCFYEANRRASSYDWHTAESFMEALYKAFDEAVEDKIAEAVESADSAIPSDDLKKVVLLYAARHYMHQYELLSLRELSGLPGAMPSERQVARKRFHAVLAELFLGNPAVANTLIEDYDSRLQGLNLKDAAAEFYLAHANQAIDAHRDKINEVLLRYRIPPMPAQEEKDGDDLTTPYVQQVVIHALQQPESREWSDKAKAWFWPQFRTPDPVVLRAERLNIENAIGASATRRLEGEIALVLNRTVGQGAER